MVRHFCGRQHPDLGLCQRGQATRLDPAAIGWAGATPSSYVTEEAFERIAKAILEDVDSAVADGGLDAVYLDLHGAAVAQHVPDCEGELLARVRAGWARMVPIVASLDLHGNVTPRMLEQADALVAYRTYPHVDMAVTGARAATLLKRRLQLGHRLTPTPCGCRILFRSTRKALLPSLGRTFVCRLAGAGRATPGVPEFLPGFPASDFDDCRPSMWPTPIPKRRPKPQPIFALQLMAQDPRNGRLTYASPKPPLNTPWHWRKTPAFRWWLPTPKTTQARVATANTTGMLHALINTGAGQRYPQVVVGMLFCPRQPRARARLAWAPN